MKNISFIIRSLPKEERAKEIISKYPRMLLYAVDITDGEESVSSQIKAAIVAFPEIKIVPMIPSAYMFRALTPNGLYMLTYFIKELFESPEIVYIDAGVSPDLNEIKDFVDTLEKAYGKEQKIGIIAPSSSYIKAESPLVEYTKAKDNITPVPYLSRSAGVSLQLNSLPIIIGEKFEAVISKVEENEMPIFGKLVEPTTVENIIFWSFEDSEGLELTIPQEAPVVEEVPAPEGEPEEQFESWVSLFSVSIRKSAGMNAEHIGACPADTKVQLVPVKELGPDGTKFGKVKHGEGLGYVVMRHSGREYFRKQE